jgi:GNAT superfamily N-acetyltransferase
MAFYCEPFAFFSGTTIVSGSEGPTVITQSGISIRPARRGDAEGIARVHVDTWRETYQGILPPRVLSAQTYARRLALWRQTLARDTARVAFVAVAERSIVGFATSGRNRYAALPFSAEMYTLYVLAEWQGEGIGQELFDRSARHLAAEGHANLATWVLTDNPSVGFYEWLGGVPVAERDERFGMAVLRQRAYGWWL